MFRFLATEWRRVRVVFGIPSVLLVVGVLFSQSIINVVTTHLSLREEIAGLTVLGVVCVTLFLRYRWAYLAAIHKTEDDPGKTQSRLAKKRALICVMGLGSGEATSPLATLLAQFNSLEYLVLLGTAETRSLGVASQITHQLLGTAGLSLDSEHVLILENNDAGAMDDFDEATRSALRWLFSNGVTSSEVLCDVTAGKRAMGFGALLASNRAGIETQYLDVGWDHVSQRQIPERTTWHVAREHTQI